MPKTAAVLTHNLPMRQQIRRRPHRINRPVSPRHRLAPMVPPGPILGADNASDNAMDFNSRAG